MSFIRKEMVPEFIKQDYCNYVSDKYKGKEDAINAFCNMVCSAAAKKEDFLKNFPLFIKEVEDIKHIFSNYDKHTNFLGIENILSLIHNFLEVKKTEGISSEENVNTYQNGLWNLTKTYLIGACSLGFCLIFVFLELMRLKEDAQNNLPYRPSQFNVDKNFTEYKLPSINLTDCIYGIGVLLSGTVGFFSARKGLLQYRETKSHLEKMNELLIEKDIKLEHYLKILEGNNYVQIDNNIKKHS
jgi:hypothetical protein